MESAMAPSLALNVTALAATPPLLEAPLSPMACEQLALFFVFAVRWEGVVRPGINALRLLL